MNAGVSFVFFCVCTPDSLCHTTNEVHFRCPRVEKNSHLSRWSTRDAVALKCLYTREKARTAAKTTYQNFHIWRKHDSDLFRFALEAWSSASTSSIVLFALSTAASEDLSEDISEMFPHRLMFKMAASRYPAEMFSGKDDSRNQSPLNSFFLFPPSWRVSVLLFKMVSFETFIPRLKP